MRIHLAELDASGAIDGQRSAKDMVGLLSETVAHGV